ncbi:UNVERIFIED_CONTAM: hypothetical protein K2H54_074178 [Gekko kuhli]
MVISPCTSAGKYDICHLVDGLQKNLWLMLKTIGADAANCIVMSRKSPPFCHFSLCFYGVEQKRNVCGSQTMSELYITRLSSKSVASQTGLILTCPICLELAFTKSCPQ